MATTMFLGFDSGVPPDGNFVESGQIATVKSTANRSGLQIERFMIHEALVWSIVSLKIGDRELIAGDSPIPATAFVGMHPMFIEAECWSGTIVSLRVLNVAGASFRFRAVMSGPQLA